MGSCYDPATGITLGLNDGLRKARTGSVWFICEDCGKRSRDKQDQVGGDNDLCVDCWDQAGLEIMHEDGEHQGAPDSGCDLCKPLLERQAKNARQVQLLVNAGGRCAHCERLASWVCIWFRDHGDQVELRCQVCAPGHADSCQPLTTKPSPVQDPHTDCGDHPCSQCEQGWSPEHYWPGPGQGED